MEAMTLGYPPEQRGQISVTATKEEWQAVIHRITQTSPYMEDDSDRLVYHLLNAGVHE